MPAWEGPIISRGEKRLRRTRRPAFRLDRALKAALGLFVVMIMLGGGLSLWTIHAMQRDQGALELAARLDHHFTLMIERAEHYKDVAPRNYPDFFRDVDLYYSALREEVETMNWLVADLARAGGDVDPDLWNRFRNGLEEQIGYEPDRPRLEWAAEFIVGESAPLAAAITQARDDLQQSASQSRERLWYASIGLALATLALAVVTAWLFRTRVLRRIAETSQAVRRMADGQFDGIGPRRADDELGQLESDVRQLARRTRDLVDLLDTLNGARSLSEAIERLPMRLKRQFSVEWLGLLEVHDGRMRLRLSLPDRSAMGLEQPGVGWPLAGTLLDDAREAGHTVFRALGNNDGPLPQRDPLLRQLGEADLVAAALLPVRDAGGISAGVVLGTRNPEAFEGWRRRWLENVGHLIADALYKSIHVEQLGISMIRGLAELAEKRDPTTGQHLDRMQRYAGILARALIAQGVVDDQRHPRFAEQVESFAPLHDIGKVAISDHILLKPGRLSRSETEEMRRHPKIGADVLMAAGERLGAEGERLLAHAMDIALYHHERYDGKGYPHGLVGEAIPLSARIVAVADVFDALTSERPYKVAWSEEDTLAYMRNERGRHFDPKVVDALFESLDEFRRVRELFADPPETGLHALGR